MAGVGMVGGDSEELCATTSRGQPHRSVRTLRSMCQGSDRHGWSPWSMACCPPVRCDVCWAGDIVRPIYQRCNRLTGSPLCLRPGAVQHSTQPRQPFAPEGPQICHKLPIRHSPYTELPRAQKGRDKMCLNRVRPNRLANRHDERCLRRSETLDLATHLAYY